MLQPLKLLAQLRVGTGADGHAELAVCFVDGSVCRKAQMILAHLPAAKQAGHAGITLLGVNLHQAASLWQGRGFALWGHRASTAGRGAWSGSRGIGADALPF